jgi:rod shape-determining protein MreD
VGRLTPAALARLRLGALLLLGVLLQTTVVPDLRIRGVCPDLMLLIAVCVGLVGGAEQGAVVGFGAGLLADLFLQTTPFGLSALAYCLIGFAVGALRGGMLREGWLIAPLVAFAASAAGVGVFVGAGVTVGQSQLTQGGAVVIAETAAIVGAMNALLAVPAARLVAWAAHGSAGATPSRQIRSDRSALSR